MICFRAAVTETADESDKVRLMVDFDQLRQELGDHIVEDGQERYRLDWPGKREALIVANTPIAKTFRPVRGESVDFDATSNLDTLKNPACCLESCDESAFTAAMRVMTDEERDFVNAAKVAVEDRLEWC